MLCTVCNKNPPFRKRRQCNTCVSRLHRAKHRVKYAFDTLKSNAKRRGHGFDLTLEQFEKWCVATDYIVGKGKTTESFSVDRIDNNKGYTLDNIRVLSLRDNSRKHTKQVVFEPMTRTFYTATLPDDEGTTISDCPF